MSARKFLIHSFLLVGVCCTNVHILQSLYGDHSPPHLLRLLPHFRAGDISNPYTNVHILQSVWWSFTPRPWPSLQNKTSCITSWSHTKFIHFFPAFFYWLSIKGTLLLDIVLVPLSWLFCTTRQNSTIFKRSYICRGFQGGRVSYWWALGRDGKFHPSLERYSQGRVYNRN